MDDDQTDPECVLLLLMERAFRGPEYANAQTRDWRTHMARVLQCVRARDRDGEIGRLARRKLASGNGVPVERCHITAKEVAAIDAARGKE